MKLTHLTGIWKETVDAYMQDIASEIMGYSYSHKYKICNWSHLQWFCKLVTLVGSGLSTAAKD